MLKRTAPGGNAFIHGRRHFKQPMHRSRDADQEVGKFADREHLAICGKQHREDLTAG